MAASTPLVAGCMSSVMYYVYVSSVYGYIKSRTPTANSIYYIMCIFSLRFVSLTGCILNYDSLHPQFLRIWVDEERKLRIGMILILSTFVP